MMFLASFSFCTTLPHSRQHDKILPTINGETIYAYVCVCVCDTGTINENEPRNKQSTTCVGGVSVRERLCVCSNDVIYIYNGK